MEGKEINEERSARNEEGKKKKKRGTVRSQEVYKTYTTICLFPILAKSYLEGKLLLDKRRGQLGNDPRHLEGVESAQNRMKLKLERIMKMKVSEE